MKPPLLTARELASAGLDGAPVQTYKNDPRSCVWRVDAPSGPCVVKRFEYAPLRQRLSLIAHLHPAQREIRRNQQLRDAGVRVVPIVDSGVERNKVWLATPLAGTSLQRLLRDGAEGDALIDATASLTNQLMGVGFTFKDLKPSNIVIDDRGDAWLIDVGSATPSVSPARVETMLSVMQRVLERDGVSESLRRRFADAIDARFTCR